MESQVYDVLVPAEAGPTLPGVDSRGILRIAFDPEALPEHAGSQLASFGTPLVDRLLADAIRRGRFAQVYVVGLNLGACMTSLSALRRSLTLGADHHFRVERVRPLHFAQAIYFFQGTFVSDQKEQEIVPVGLDLHYGRQVRHLEQLMDPARLSEQAVQPLPEARRLSLGAGYPIARERVIRTLAAMANSRARELDERLAKQVARMSQYYADLRQEVEDQARRGHKKEEDPGRLAGRRAALDREEHLRVTELRQKSSLRMELRSAQSASDSAAQAAPPRPSRIGEGRGGVGIGMGSRLMEAVEPPPCPSCGRPGFAFELTRQGRLVCPGVPGFSEGGTVSGK